MAAWPDAPARRQRVQVGALELAESSTITRQPRRTKSHIPGQRPSLLRWFGTYGVRDHTGEDTEPGGSRTATERARRAGYDTRPPRDSGALRVDLTSPSTSLRGCPPRLPEIPCTNRTSDSSIGVRVVRLRDASSREDIEVVARHNPGVISLRSRALRAVLGRALNLHAYRQLCSDAAAAALRVCADTIGGAGLVLRGDGGRRMRHVGARIYNSH